MQRRNNRNDVIFFLSLLIRLYSLVSTCCWSDLQYQQLPYKPPATIAIALFLIVIYILEDYYPFIDLSCTKTAYVASRGALSISCFASWLDFWCYACCQVSYRSFGLISSLLQCQFVAMEGFTLGSSYGIKSLHPLDTLPHDRVWNVIWDL